MVVRAIVVIGMLILACTPRQGAGGSSGANYSGGNGDSFHEAVIITGAGSKSGSVAGEYAFISNLHGRRGDGWHLVGQTVIREKSKIVDVIEIQLGSVSDRRIYYFDVSEYFSGRR